MKRIQSKLYKIGTYEVYKLSLPFFDDTRYILDEDINSLAYFCKDTRYILDEGINSLAYFCKDIFRK